MSRSLPRATASSRATRSRRFLAAAVLVLGSGALLLEGSTFAASEAAIDETLDPAGLEPAVRKVAKVAPVPPPPVPSAPASHPSTRSLSVDAHEVLQLLNRERAAAGIAPVVYEPSLEVAAAIHAYDQRNQPCLAGFLTHVGTDGSRGIDRIDRAGLRVSRWGENIACSFTTPQMVMAGWMRSPGHAATALDARFTHVGIAVAASDTGQLYWVQLFGTPRS